jgi:hypothetical protein
MASSNSYSSSDCITEITAPPANAIAAGSLSEVTKFLTKHAPSFTATSGHADSKGNVYLDYSTFTSPALLDGIESRSNLVGDSRISVTANHQGSDMGTGLAELKHGNSSSKHSRASLAVIINIMAHLAGLQNEGTCEPFSSATLYNAPLISTKHSAQNTTVSDFMTKITALHVLSSLLQEYRQGYHVESIEELIAEFMDDLGTSHRAGIDNITSDSVMKVLKREAARIPKTPKPETTRTAGTAGKAAPKTVAPLPLPEDYPKVSSLKGIFAKLLCYLKRIGKVNPNAAALLIILKSFFEDVAKAQASV